MREQKLDRMQFYRSTKIVNQNEQSQLVAEMLMHSQAVCKEKLTKRNEKKRNISTQELLAFPQNTREKKAYATTFLISSKPFIEINSNRAKFSVKPIQFIESVPEYQNGEGGKQKITNRRSGRDRRAARAMRRRPPPPRRWGRRRLCARPRAARATPTPSPSPARREPTASAATARCP
jgi:hypothetical protein